MLLGRAKPVGSTAHDPSPATGGASLHSGEPRQWWESRGFVLALMILSMVPLLYPRVPPLVDLPGHMGRYQVQLALDSSPWLARYYDFGWAPIGNLGVDLLLVPLAPLLGLELAVKLIVISIPPLTVAGFLWVAREVHHRLPPMALFSLPFVYNYPFLFGFANFALSMALAFIAFGLWLRLGRLHKLNLRAILFVPISFILYFTHAFGWGTLGLLAFSAEAVRQHDSGRGWFRSAFNAALHASVMALPIAVMLAWRMEASEGMTRNWFEWRLKWEWVHSALRDRWRTFDWASLAVIPLLLLFVLFSRRLTMSRNLVFSALVLLACFLLLPWTMFGSAYTDMRMAPYMIALVPIAMRFKADTHLTTARVIAVLGLAFFLVRIAGTTASLAITARDQEAKLEALDHVPVGARVANLVGRLCGRPWPLPRNSHIGGMVIVRRHGFVNDQWTIDGQNLLQVHYPAAGAFEGDPSQIVAPNYCPPPRWTVDRALHVLPRHAFDYLWLVDVPRFDRELLEGMELVWRGPGTELYRINPAGGEPRPETRRTEAEGGR